MNKALVNGSSFNRKKSLNVFVCSHKILASLFTITLHFYLRMVLICLFRGLITVTLCAMFSQPAPTLFTGSFYYSASEPTL